MAKCNMRFRNKFFSKITLHFHFALASLNNVCDIFFLIKGAINKLRMYKYLQKKTKHDHKCKQQLTRGIFCNV